jgi:hypothetical protein
MPAEHNLIGWSREKRTIDGPNNLTPIFKEKNKIMVINWEQKFLNTEKYTAFRLTVWNTLRIK